MIEQLVSDLKSDEGWQPKLYKDSLGLWSLGYGFLVDPDKEAELPEAVGEFWLRFVLDRRLLEMNHRLPWLKNQPDDVRRALMNMAYQLGVGGVLQFARMLAALRSGNRQLAATEALDSEWHRQTPGRAQRVAALIRG